MGNLKVSDKLLLSYVIIMILFVISSFIFVTNSKTVISHFKFFYDHPFKVTNTAKDLKIEILSMRISIKDVILEDDLDYAAAKIEEFESDKKQVEKNIKILRDTYLGDAADIDAFETKYHQWVIVADRVLELVRDGDSSSAADLSVNTALIYADDMMTQLDKIITYADHKANSFYDQASGTQDSTELYSMVFLLIIILASLLLTAILTRNINGPIQEMMNAVKAVEAGEEAECDARGRKDEFGKVMEAFNGMLAYLKTEKELEQKIRDQQALILDIEKTRNKELAKSIEVKDEFLSLVSHELKTPIAVITSAIQTMKLVCKDELSDKAEGYLNKIQRNSYRQLKLVNNILENTKIEEGHLGINKTNVNIVVLTKAIIEVAAHFAEQKNIKLSFASTEEEIVTGIDVEQYDKILLNLLSNAIKFTPEGKSIDVRVSLKTIEGMDKVFIAVADEGIGIPEEKRDKIFKKFGQVDSLFSRHAEGTGLGLYIVKMLVELHDGEIVLASNEGTGSTFTVILPAVKVNECPLEQINPHKPIENLITETTIEFSDIY